MRDLMLDVGLANELKMSFRRNGWNEAQIKKASEGDFFAHVRRVLLGQAEIVSIEHVIDLDADPFVPDGWSFVEHQKGGQFQWDTTRLKLCHNERQKGGKVIKGNKLRKELAKKAVFNANVLDYLLAHPYLAPEEWKGKFVFFWGTIYRGRGGNLCVRCLYWSDDGWTRSFNSLDNGWYDDYLAVVDAS